MINKITIQNFQSHTDSVLELSPGVNVITGSSDNGKSAIVKALRWLVRGKPMGDEFRNWNGGDVEVSASLTDGTIITKTKTKSETLYRINDNKPLVGADVPEEIQKIFNITDINLHQQLTLPFLLTETPGNVAKHFSCIARIDQIHKTEKGINGAISRINHSIEKHENDIKKHTQELQEFPDLVKIEIELEVLENLETKRNQVSKSISDLNILIRHIDTVDERIENDSKLLIFEEEVDNLLLQIRERDSKSSQILQLTKVIGSIKTTDDKIKEFSKKIQHEKAIDDILLRIEESRVITANLRALNELVDKVYYLDKELVKTEETALQIEARFKKEFPSVCPLCNTPKKEIKL